MSANYLNKGSYNVICDRCGQKHKREDMRKEWTGLLTCFNCYDPRHPWTLPLPIAIDALPVPDARPRPNGIDVLPNGLDISKWGGPYQDILGNISSNAMWGNFDYVWGTQDIPYNSTNFPLV